MVKQQWAILDAGAKLVFTCQDCGVIFQFTTEELSGMSGMQLMASLEAHGCEEQIRRQSPKATGAA